MIMLIHAHWQKLWTLLDVCDMMQLVCPTYESQSSRGKYASRSLGGGRPCVTVTLWYSRTGNGKGIRFLKWVLLLFWCQMVSNSETIWLDIGIWCIRRTMQLKTFVAANQTARILPLSLGSRQLDTTYHLYCISTSSWCSVAVAFRSKSRLLLCSGSDCVART